MTQEIEENEENKRQRNRLIQESQQNGTLRINRERKDPNIDDNVSMRKRWIMRIREETHYLKI